ncbi:unnamed protein product [Didymodactylos carnosus]|uniref:MATH domain-containing protein n=1 Tax=Didymodactylos carnosus TaxID=1234261 RepID=A0A814I0L7_9BILA|nr:unnamed protein product [Didymodactylos carnosus]CAF1260316.1 unnamed protein product [Didymodactylos carnosus]CAF3788558.1 unnamed protein product [Didymodactylos carnosus]CAF4066964.1 unnamed protein product [Didymodactylos carnosus]
MRAAQLQEQQTLPIYSQPFYSSPSGYKMRARLYPDGNEKNARGTHISIFFVLMRGEFDQLLQWPFSFEVMFCLFDQSGENRHIIRSFSPCDFGKLPSFQRPHAGMNPGWGIPKFAPLTMLHQSENPYIMHDTITIKILAKGNELPKSMIPHIFTLNPIVPLNIDELTIVKDLALLDERQISTVGERGEGTWVEENLWEVLLVRGAEEEKIEREFYDNYLKRRFLQNNLSATFKDFLYGIGEVDQAKEFCEFLQSEQDQSQPNKERFPNPRNYEIYVEVRELVVSLSNVMNIPYVPQYLLIWLDDHIRNYTSIQNDISMTVGHGDATVIETKEGFIVRSPSFVAVDTISAFLSKIQENQDKTLVIITSGAFGKQVIAEQFKSVDSIYIFCYDIATHVSDWALDHIDRVCGMVNHEKGLNITMMMNLN